MALSIPAQDVMKLRSRCGAGFMDCKKALEETKGDFDKALEILRKKGLATAHEKAARAAGEGLVISYIHHSGKVGVLLELGCETDFVAKSPDFEQLGKEMALQIAAMSPRWIRQQDIPQSVLEKEKEIYCQQAADMGKPAAALEKIAAGKLSKFCADFCLLDQPSVRDSSGKTKVSDMIAAAIAKLGENVVVKRFVRFQVGDDTAR